MASSSTPLLLLLLLVSTAANASSDSAALRRVLNSLGVPLPQFSDPCLYPGITCDDDGRVTHIALPSYGLGGSLTPAIGRLYALVELSLPGNRLSGPVPREISRCSRLRVLDLTGNEFDGDLGFLTQLYNLEVVSLSNNNFSGRVPRALSSFRGLRALDLSGNPSLVGPIPRLPSEKKATLPVPLTHRYILAETTNSSTNSTSGGRAAAGNGTTNSSGTAAPSPAAAPTASPAKHHSKTKRKVKSWILGFVVGAVAGVIAGVLCSVLFRLLVDIVRGRFRNMTGAAIFSPQIKAEDLAFLEKDAGVATMELIGRGGCGEVYRYALPPSGEDGSPGKLLAIKKIIKFNLSEATTEIPEEESRLLDKRMRQLRSEIQTVGHIRHRNLLPLLAHVPRQDCNYLVYEYMKNGSLQDALKAAAEGQRELPWPTRLRIAQGIAAGLEYLHTQHSPKIIHRDLKPANILLDDDLEARIADFGLAKAMPDANTHMTTSNVAGTVGYIAPEYHQMLKFTDKCDVYSFGVILAVLVVGKMPSDEFFQSTEEMSLVRWLRNVMHGGEASAVEAADAKLRGNGHEKEMVLMMKIACFCTADEPKQRPNSREVRCMLAQLTQA